MDIVGYARVSTENQREEGTIEIQQSALIEYASANGFNLIKTFTDNGVSGGLENRTGLSSLFDFLEQHQEITAVLIFKLDRLARDLYLQEHLIQKLESMGKVLYSIKEANLDSNDPMRKAFRQFMGIVSELEKSFITMRLSGGRINKAKKGRYAGGSPALGYTPVDKELNLDANNTSTIKSIFNMKSANMGLREIARRLNADNIPTARGGKWYAGTVKYILENPVYKGIIKYANVTANNDSIAII